MTKIFDDQGLHVGSIIDGAVIDDKGVRRAHGFRRGIFELVLLLTDSE